MSRFLLPNEKLRFSIFQEPSLIRTGSCNDGSCFFYSLNTAFKEFRDATEEEKKDFIMNQRRTLSEQLLESDWMNVQQGHLAFLQIIFTLRSLFFILHFLHKSEMEQQCLVTPKDGKMTEQMETWKEEWKSLLQEPHAFSLWVTCFPIEYLDQDFLSEWNQQLSPKTTITKEMIFRTLLSLIEQRCQDVFETMEEKGKQTEIDGTMKECMVNGLCDLWKLILEKCIQQTFSQQKKRIETYSTWVDMDTILCILSYLPYQVIFLHADTEQVYFDTSSLSQNHVKDNEEEEEVIVLLYYPDCHFENIGKVVVHENNRQKIIRLFTSQDSFIQCLRTQSQSYSTIPSQQKMEEYTHTKECC